MTVLQGVSYLSFAGMETESERLSHRTHSQVGNGGPAPGPLPPLGLLLQPVGWRLLISVLRLVPYSLHALTWCVVTDASAPS